MHHSLQDHEGTETRFSSNAGSHSSAEGEVGVSDEGKTCLSDHKDSKMTGMSDVDLMRSAQWQGQPAPALDTWDHQVLARFVAEQPWGMETSVDVLACDPATIRDPQHIRAFALALCDFIHMHRYGEPLIVHFGEEERVSGYTLVQLIETSDITSHFIEQGNAGCLSIFSCASYPPYQVAAFCQRWFGAQQVRVSVQFRGPAQTDRHAPVGEGEKPAEGESTC